MDFNAIINLGVVAAGLLFGALLRARVKLLQRYLIPSAIIGGFFLLLFYNFVAPRINLNADFLGDLVYHLLNISFIAMALRNPSDEKPSDGSGRKAFVQNVIAIFGQYGLQCFFGLLATLVMILTFFPDLFFQYVTLFLPSRISIKHGWKKRCPFLVRHNKRLSKTRYPNASNIRAALRHAFYDCKYAVSYTCNVDLMLVMLSGYRVIPVFL